MAYGDWAGAIAPWPGQQRRDALLELLSTPNISTEFTAPFYEQFMADRGTAQQSRQDYLTQMLETLSTAAMGGQTQRQASMLMDAVQNAYGIKPSSQLIPKAEATLGSLYPERRNPLKEMPGGTSPLSQEAPVSYEDMLALNSEVKLGVAQGKTMDQIYNGIINRIRGAYENPNYNAELAQLDPTMQQYMVPENWASIEGAVRSIVTRAYEQFSGQPGVELASSTQPAPATAGEGVTDTGGVDLLGALISGAPVLGGAGAAIAAARRAGMGPMGMARGLWNVLPHPLRPVVSALDEVLIPRPGAVSPRGLPYGQKPLQTTRFFPQQTQQYGPAAQMPSATTPTTPTTPTAPRGPSAPAAPIPTQAYGTPPGYRPQQSPLTQLSARNVMLDNLPPGWGSSNLINMALPGILQATTELAGEPNTQLEQQVAMGQLRNSSIAIDADEVQVWQQIDGAQVWQDPVNGQWMVYLPVSEW